MIRQSAIIFGCLAVGELLVHFTGIKLPSSIIGMILLTTLLKIGWLKLEWVKDIANFFVKTLPFYFVPAGVAVVLYFDLIKEYFWSILVSALGSTIIILVVTGWMHQHVRHRGKRYVQKKNQKNA